MLGFSSDVNQQNQRMRKLFVIVACWGLKYWFYKQSKDTFKSGAFEG